MGKKKDYSEAWHKFDKFMPEDPEIQDEYYEILEEKDVDAMEEFLNTHAVEDIMEGYFPKGGTVRGFAEYIIEMES